jgi:Iodothyronine deiodinase
MSDYNYSAFSFAMDEVGVSKWSSDGPKAGDRAPSFSLPTLDGEVVSLESLTDRPVVIEFGSYTCPIFCGQIPAMESVAHRHPEAVFLVIYTREAHPGEVTPEHRSMQAKQAAARRLLDEEPISRTILIDDLDGTVHRCYGPAWDSVYVLDSSHRVVLRQAWTHPDDVEAILAELATGSVVSPRESTEMAPPTGGPMGQGLLRGGKQAVIDFYQTAPPPVKDRLRQSPSAEVREVISSLTH